MTTELTLREKAAEEVMFALDNGEPLRRSSCPTRGQALHVIDRIADLLSATGAPAYIRVADDLRGVVREEGE